jgi:hypothetical protein
MVVIILNARISLLIGEQIHHIADKCPEFPSLSDNRAVQIRESSDNAFLRAAYRRFAVIGGSLYKTSRTWFSLLRMFL